MLNVADRKWKKALVLIALGLCVVAALPPFYMAPLAFVGISGLFLFLDKAKTKKEAFFTGWMFGIGFFGGGLYWLTNAFLVHSDKHGWLVPIAVPALAAAVGLFIGVTCLVAHLFWQRRKKAHQVYGRIMLFAVAWVLLEWVRSWLFTGFPWNMIGTIWGFSDEMLQPAAYFGSFGLSLFTILALTLPAGLFYVEGKQRIAAALAVLVIPAGLWTTGYLRLDGVEVQYQDDVLLRIVQPNVEQKNKWKKEFKVENFQRHLQMTQAAGENPDIRPTHIIWPETAVTFPLSREPYVRQAIGSVTPAGGVVLTGTPMMTQRNTKPFQVWNSLVAVNEVGQIAARYDKSHLVPFGEYIPLREVLTFIPKLTGGLVDFSPGIGPQTIEISGLPSFSPLICYEIIFPNRVVDKKNRPEWLLNLTNDGWYGDSPGPYQHLISARLRSIEEGLPLVRNANTGITVVTDGYGRVQSSIRYGKQAFIDSRLPTPIANMPSISDYPFLSWSTLLVILFTVGQLLVSRRSKYDIKPRV